MAAITLWALKPMGWIFGAISSRINSPDNGNNGQITWNSDCVQLGSGWEFTRAGRYDFTGNYPSEPPNQVGSDAIYPVANLGYNVATVPEPAILTFFGLSGAAFLISTCRRSR